ncbi:MAG TPA: [FeFe] hydrogenase H-cluster maturation GTPase HydF [Clostridiales bacterium UBA8960]|nr:[FeFe] hydrogenase H-cluster maturation GTPase HydF [Clostridiales bacterium UBA8960]
MNKTPHANRLHIGIFGNRNAGKSSLFNAIIGQDIAVVSEVEGTTTDPVIKAMELIPFGPVVWIDTAGLDDVGILGSLRVEKTKKMLERTDFALYVMDGTQPDLKGYEQMKGIFKRFNIPYMLIVNKKDAMSEDSIKKLECIEDEKHFVSTMEMRDIHTLNSKLMEKLRAIEDEEVLVGDLLPYGSTVVLVVPIDSEAPKGRIILPQVQIIRDCLDHGIKCHVVRDTELTDALSELSRVDLVITDSQAFKEVSKLVPESIPLTGFSILFSRQKGDLKKLLSGIEALKSLKSGSRVLISETCTHNHSHEDIGRVKIPRLIHNHLHSDIQIDFSMGHDFPHDLSKYDLVIHCGACMVNRKTMLYRIDQSHEAEVPITNYGLTLAHFSGILDRSIEILKDRI